MRSSEEFVARVKNGPGDSAAIDANLNGKFRGVRPSGEGNGLFQSIRSGKYCSGKTWPSSKAAAKLLI